MRITSCCAGATCARAARCACWLVFVLLNGGEFARAGGWLARARRLLDDGQRDCAEQGHLLVPDALQQAAAGDCAGALRDRRPGRRDRRSVRRRRPGGAGPQHPGPRADCAGRDRRGDGPARRGHGRGDRRTRCRRCVAGDRLLQRDRGAARRSSTCAGHRSGRPR